MKPAIDRIQFEAWSIINSTSGALYRPGPRQHAIMGQTEAKAMAEIKSSKRVKYEAVRIRVNVEAI